MSNDTFNLFDYVNFQNQPPFTDKEVRIFSALEKIASTPEGQDIIMKAVELHGEKINFAISNESDALGSFNPGSKTITISQDSIEKMYAAENENGYFLQSSSPERIIFHEFYHAADENLVGYLGKPSSMISEEFTAKLYNYLYDYNDEKTDPGFEAMRNRISRDFDSFVESGWINDEVMLKLAAEVDRDYPYERDAVDAANSFMAQYFNQPEKITYSGYLIDSPTKQCSDYSSVEIENAGQVFGPLQLHNIDISTALEVSDCAIVDFEAPGIAPNVGGPNPVLRER